ncbi:MAG: hypothetical protein R3C53_13850 [Pirellulaceae bacterium]
MKEKPPVVQPSPAEPPVAHSPVRAHPGQQTPPKKSVLDLLDNRWVMFVMLFGVTAALGLPLLWRSRGFSRTEKIFWSVVVSLYTVLIFWIFFKIMYWSYSNIVNSLE